MRSRCAAILARLFAILAAHREGQRAQARLRDFVAALEAEAVTAVFETRERFVDLVERFRLHLDQRQLDVFLDVDFGGLALIHHFVRLLRAVGADAANLPLHFGDELALTLLEHVLEFVVPGALGCRDRVVRFDAFAMIPTAPSAVSHRS